MSRRTTAATIRQRRTSWVVIWAALALALSFALAALRPAGVWADAGGTITIMPAAGGSLYVAGSNLTASFTTDGALNGNTPLSVAFISTATQADISSTYTILSSAGTTYTAIIPIPDLAPGAYTLEIAGQEINSGRLTSAVFTIVAPTPTPIPTLTPTPPPSPVPLIGAQAHDVPPGTGGISGGVIAAVAAGGLLLVSLALLIVPPLRLRRRGNQPPR